MRRIIQQARKVSAANAGLDIETTARRLGVQVQEVLESLNLKQVYFSDLQSIVLRPGLPVPERSYLIAHGLGHHLLHRDGLRLGRPGRPRLMSCGGLLNRGRATRLEREADIFAAYLLVPDARLNDALAQGWVQEDDDPVLALALEFAVPEELLRERLVYQGISC